MRSRGPTGHGTSSQSVPIPATAPNLEESALVSPDLNWTPSLQPGLGSLLLDERLADARPIKGALPGASPGDTAGSIRLKVARKRGLELTRNTLAPSDDHPVVQHLDRVRSTLSSKGLPFDAPNVEIHVLGEGKGDHRRKVGRAAGGPGSLTPGAKLHLHSPIGTYSPIRHRSDIRSGRADLDQTLDYAVDKLKGFVLEVAGSIRQLREDLPPSDQTRVATLSLGLGPDDVAQGVVKRVLDRFSETGEVPPLVADVNAQRRAQGQAPIDLSSPNARQDLIDAVGMAILDRLDEPKTRTRIARARQKLTKEVAKARDTGIYVMAAAGNEGRPLSLYESVQMPIPRRSADQYRSMLDGIPGLRLVGASHTGKTPGAEDDALSKMTSPGADFLTLGTGMPIGDPIIDDKGRRVPKDASGTSYASPHGASVVALMIEARPDITPDEIDGVLSRASRNLRFTARDGWGIVDEAQAVQLSKRLLRGD